jgi:hypothetical protein
MELLKENWIRLAYGAASMGIVWAAYHFRVEVLSDKDSFDRFSYIGGVATFIGLLITVSEVLQAISISKGIRAEARALLAEARKIDRAALLSECLLLIDRINDDLIDNRRSTALQCVQQTRRSFLRAVPPSPESDELCAGLVALEAHLQDAIRSNDRNDHLSKRVLTDIQERSLDVKQALEKLISGRSKPHVS